MSLLIKNWPNASFWKYHGTGNDFVLLDFSLSSPPVDLPNLARHLCDRRHGIGADGLLVLLPSSRADFRMQIFNADGSEPSMCGNGIRCLASYIFKRDQLLEVSIETAHAVLKCRRFEGEVAVNLGVPTTFYHNLPVENQNIYVVNTGVPHAVIFVDHLDEIDVNQLGRQVRFSPHFSPQGVNVNFVSVTHDGKVAVRTYERGVEAETLACGTGAAAAAFVTMKVKKLESPIPIQTRASFDGSKISYHQQLRFCFSKGENPEIEMIGSAHEVFAGTIDVGSE